MIKESSRKLWCCRLSCSQAPRRLRVAVTPAAAAHRQVICDQYEARA